MTKVNLDIKWFKYITQSTLYNIPKIIEPCSKEVLEYLALAPSKKGRATFVGSTVQKVAVHIVFKYIHLNFCQ